MSEFQRPHNGENSYGPGKFNNARDEALYLMAAEGWSNQSDGDVNAPTGWFSRVTNSYEELAELEDVFGDDLRILGVELRQVQGHFLLREDEQGFVSVKAYDTPQELDVAYNALAARYNQWRSEVGDD